MPPILPLFLAKVADLQQVPELAPSWAARGSQGVNRPTECLPRLSPKANVFRMSDEGYESGRQSPSCMASERDVPTTGQDTKRLADEAAKDLQVVLERAGVSDDLLRNVVQKVQQRGRGGRTPAGDPRLDPTIEPKKAKRILANRLSAAKSKMRQRVLSESLEVLKAKENSRHASVEPSDDGAMMGYDAGPSTGASSDELRQVKRMCMELQSKNKELEARMRLLEAQMTIASSSSFHPHLGGQGLRVLSAPSGFSSDASAMLAALTAAHGGSSVGNQSSRPPLVSSNLQQSTLNLLNLSSAAALAQSNLGRGLQVMDSNGRMDGGGGASCWLNMDCNGSGLGQLMVPSLGMLQHSTHSTHSTHQGLGLQLLPPDAQVHKSSRHHDE